MKRAVIAAVLMCAALTAVQNAYAAEGVLLGAPDPAIIAAPEPGGGYYVFHTGVGMHVLYSEDLLRWRRVDTVFDTPVPEWAAEAVPGTQGIWAPDIAYFNGRYHLYYSVSTFGSQRSVMGLATNTTLDPESPNYEWVDQGLVIDSDRGRTDFNAIDPAAFADNDGRVYFFWGSYWTGLKAVELDPATGKRLDPEGTIHPIATRAGRSTAIEAPFVIKRGQYYYLFVSWDACCDGADSTYKVMVGRSQNVLGPYVDFTGERMDEGGGTLVLASHSRWRGPGHNSILRHGGKEWMAHHTYDAENLEAQRILQVREMYWTEDGWPVVDAPVRETRVAEPNATPAGRWEHRVDYNDETMRTLRLLPDFTIEGVEGARWEWDLRSLTLTWPDEDAPGGTWKDVLHLGADGNSYVGRNQSGQVISGLRIEGEE